MAISSFKYIDRENNEFEQIDDDDLKEIRRNRILDQKCWSILKEFMLYIVFVIILFQVTFSNVSLSSMQYNILFQNTFVTPQTPSEIGLNDVNKNFALNF